MKNQDRVYLTHILDAIMRIESYVAVGHDEFMATPHWQDAVIRQLEIVGEATKQLTQDLWRRMRKFPSEGLRVCAMCSFTTTWVSAWLLFGK